MADTDAVREAIEAVHVLAACAADLVRFHADNHNDHLRIVDKMAVASEKVAALRSAPPESSLGRACGVCGHSLDRASFCERRDCEHRSAPPKAPVEPPVTTPAGERPEDVERLLSDFWVTVATLTSPPTLDTADRKQQMFSAQMRLKPQYWRLRDAVRSLAARLAEAERKRDEWAGASCRVSDELAEYLAEDKRNDDEVGLLKRALSEMERQCQSVEAKLSEAEHERGRLLSEVREWLCEHCNAVFPGPPAPGLSCVTCPRCGGDTAPRPVVEVRKLSGQLTKAREQRDTALALATELMDMGTGTVSVTTQYTERLARLAALERDIAETDGQ
jgi:rubrerythrin